MNWYIVIIVCLVALAIDNSRYQKKKNMRMNTLHEIRRQTEIMANKKFGGRVEKGKNS